MLTIRYTMQLREEVVGLIQEVAATFQQFQGRRAAAAGVLAGLEADLPLLEQTKPLLPLVPGPDEVPAALPKPSALLGEPYDVHMVGSLADLGV